MKKADYNKLQLIDDTRFDTDGNTLMRNLIAGECMSVLSNELGMFYSVMTQPQIVRYNKS